MDRSKTRHKALRICWALCCFAYLSLPAPAPAQGIIRITTGEWQPFLSEKLPHFGVLSRVITQAFAREDVTATFGFFPWARSLAFAKSGRWDASAVWYYHPDRVPFFWHSDPVITSEEVFLHLTHFPFHWEDWSDLQGLTVGATIGHTVTKLLTEKAAKGNFHIELADSDETNLKKLLKGYIHICPMNREAALSLLDAQFGAAARRQIAFHPKTVCSGKLYLLVSKKNRQNREMLHRFNRGLKKLKADGTYAALISGRQRPHL